MNLYLLPGLGADERLFQYLKLDGHNVIPIKWTKPGKNESIEEYATKIASQVSHENSVLIGVSFGGMMSIEVAKIVPIQKVILISSCERFDELPALYRLAGKLKLQGLLTGGILKNSHRMMNWVMGAADPLRKKLLADMLRDTDEHFLYWSLNKIVSWTNSELPKNVFRIHGDRDKVLPLRKADYLIKNGGHLMIANRANEVTSAINEILSKQS